MTMHEIITFAPLLARAGGGGSSSGGGSGGIIILGYVPPHFVGYWTRKRLSFDLAAIISGIFGIVYALLLAVVFAGSLFMLVLPAAALVGTGAGIFGWFDSLLKRSKQAKAAVARAQQADSVWDEAALRQRTTEVFGQFQTDWSQFNLEHMRTYLDAAYLEHVTLMMQALYNLKRSDQVLAPVIKDLLIIDAFDDDNNDNDTFTIQVTAQADDRLLDTRNGAVIFEDTSPFTEFWQFSRRQDSWLLSDIRQSTADLSRANSAIANFAQASGLHYSLDWGWLLLPLRGELFGRAKFGTSDINNHCVGLDRGLLIQLYTYLPFKQQATRQYVIAQAALPKQYDDLVVRPRLPLQFLRPVPRGYNRLSLEWPDFNRRYEVLATNVEQVTAFELLHPVFMEKLFALPFRVGIEVVDNTLYLYTNDKGVEYGQMLSILHDAFNEMKL